MGLLESLRRAFGKAPQPAQSSAGVDRRRQDEAEIRVPEVTASEVMAEMKNGSESRPFMLDCREDFERRQAFIPDTLHIPMNSIPYRLTELPRDRDILVYCAHGNRSYGVAAWLMQQGYTARSLRGGIVDWQARGGAVESGLRRG